VIKYVHHHLKAWSVSCPCLRGISLRENIFIIWIFASVNHDHQLLLLSRASASEKSSGCLSQIWRCLQPQERQTHDVTFWKRILLGLGVISLTDKINHCRRENGKPRLCDQFSIPTQPSSKQPRGSRTEGWLTAERLSFIYRLMWQARQTEWIHELCAGELHKRDVGRKGHSRFRKINKCVKRGNSILHHGQNILFSFNCMFGPKTVFYGINLPLF